MHSKTAFLARPVVSTAVNKFHIERVRYRFSRARTTTVAFVTASVINCDVISSMWTDPVEDGVRVWRKSFLSSFMYSLCRVKNKITYVFS